MHRMRRIMNWGDRARAQIGPHYRELKNENEVTTLFKGRFAKFNPFIHDSSLLPRVNVNGGGSGTALTAHGTLEKATKVLWPPSTVDDDMPSFSGDDGRGAASKRHLQSDCYKLRMTLTGFMVI